MAPARKVTVSLPGHILEGIDSVASRRGKARSAVIAAMLGERLQEAEAQDMKEGYLALATENVSVAAGAASIASEVLLEWK